MPEHITFDNLSLSEPNLSVSEAQNSAIDRTEPNRVAKVSSAIDCTGGTTDKIETYIRESRSANTLKAYAADLKAFQNWGGAIPSNPDQVARYLADRADYLKPATLARHLVTIAVAHRSAGFPSPTESELVRSVLKGIRRVKGINQKSAKPLLKEDLFAILDAMGETIKDARDRSLLLLGFAGGFRRSELVGLNAEDLLFVRQGMIVTLRHSKTDQEGAGRKIGIPYGRTKHCPVRATENWMVSSGIAQGPIYPSLGKGGQIKAPRLSNDAIPQIIRLRLSAADINPEGFSGHSLRSGFATSAAMAGVATWRIRKQTGHASDVMLGRYIRDGELFTDNAASVIL